MTHEEPEFSTDIRDFTTLFYVTLRRKSPEWLESSIESDLKITNLAKTCSKKIHFAPYRSHAISIPLFIHYNTFPLNFQYCKSVCTIMHDVSNNSLPANISNLFLYPTQVHSYNTRFYSEIGNFNIKYSRSNH